MSYTQTPCARSKLLSMESSEYNALTPVPGVSPRCCNFINRRNRKPVLAIVVLLLVGGIACSTMLFLDHAGFWDDASPLDTAWFRQSLTNTTSPRGLFPRGLGAANPVIYSVAPAPNASEPYLYRSQFDATWTYLSPRSNFTTLLTQCRLIFNLATAWNATRNASYYVAMRSGVESLQLRFNDTEHGGFWNSINDSDNGSRIDTTIDTTKNAEAHSAVLYALSEPSINFLHAPLRSCDVVMMS